MQLHSVRRFSHLDENRGTGIENNVTDGEVASLEGKHVSKCSVLGGTMQGSW
jgi:hypothetical protein